MVKVKFLNFLCTWCYGYELHNFFAVGDELVESETTSHAQLDCFLHCGGWLESVIILWPHQWKWRKLHCSSLTWTRWNMPSISQENVKGSCLKLHWSVKRILRRATKPLTAVLCHLIFVGHLFPPVVEQEGLGRKF